MQTNFLDQLEPAPAKPFVPPHNGTATSKAAAESIDPSKAATDREAVYRFVASREQGATREEIEHGTGLNGNTVRPRVWELMRANRLHESSEQRKTNSGRMASVLVATKRDTTGPGEALLSRP